MNSMCPNVEHNYADDNKNDKNDNYNHNDDGK